MKIANMFFHSIQWQTTLISRSHPAPYLIILFDLNGPTNLVIELISDRKIREINNLSLLFSSYQAISLKHKIDEFVTSPVRNTLFSTA